MSHAWLAPASDGDNLRWAGPVRELLRGFSEFVVQEPRFHSFFSTMRHTQRSKHGRRQLFLHLWKRSDRIKAMQPTMPPAAAFGHASPCHIYRRVWCVVCLQAADWAEFRVLLQERGVGGAGWARPPITFDVQSWTFPTSSQKVTKLLRLCEDRVRCVLNKDDEVDATSWVRA